MSFFEATVAPGGQALACQGFAVPTPARLRAALAGRDGLKVVLGVRPENVVAEGRAPRGPTTPLEVTVEIAEPLGDEVVVHARIGEAPLVFKQDPHRIPALGSALTVQLELDALHLFDAGTQRRLGD
jgi:multiple sugar transport system ATP-binding protein